MRPFTRRYASTKTTRMFTLAMMDGSRVTAQPNEVRNGVSCNHHSLPTASNFEVYMVVRHPNPSSRAFTLCFVHGSSFPCRFSVPRSVECFIIVRVVMSVGVTRRFSESRDDDVHASAEKNPHLTKSQYDIEQGSGN